MKRRYALTGLGLVAAIALVTSAVAGIGGGSAQVAAKKKAKPGPAGPQGPAALQGAQGSPGPQGVQGQLGPQGAQGPGALGFDLVTPADGTLKILVTVGNVVIKAMCAPDGDPSFDFATAELVVRSPVQGFANLVLLTKDDGPPGGTAPRVLDTQSAPNTDAVLFSMENATNGARTVAGGDISYRNATQNLNIAIHMAVFPTPSPGSCGFAGQVVPASV